MCRALLSALLLIACGPPAPGPEKPASGVAEPIRPVEREGLPLRCDDDRVGALRSELLAPGGSPRVPVAFRAAADDSTFQITRRFDGEPAATEFDVVAADNTIRIAAGDAYAVLSFAGRSVSMTDGQSQTKRNRPVEVIPRSVRLRRTRPGRAASSRADRRRRPLAHRGSRRVRLSRRRLPGARGRARLDQARGPAPRVSGDDADHRIARGQPRLRRPSPRRRRPIRSRAFKAPRRAGGSIAAS